MNCTTSARRMPRLLTAVTALVLTACTENAGARLAAPEDFTAAQSASSQNLVPLAIAVGGTPNRIVNDGNGEYVNGVASVEAYIDGYGTLHFNTGARRLGFDFSVQPTGAYAPNLTGMGKAQVLTQTNGLLQPEPMLTALSVGGAACYPLSIGFSTPSTSFWVLFHSTTENTAASSSTYAYITRTGSATWTADVGNSARCGGNANWAGLWTLDLTARKATRVPRGYYAMPFTMQLRAL